MLELCSLTLKIRAQVIVELLKDEKVAKRNKMLLIPAEQGDQQKCHVPCKICDWYPVEQYFLLKQLYES